MKFKSYTGITWSILELEGLLEDEDSNVYFEKFKKHLGLHPFHLTNLNAALNEILSSNLNAYDAEYVFDFYEFQNYVCIKNMFILIRFNQIKPKRINISWLCLHFYSYENYSIARFPIRIVAD